MKKITLALAGNPNCGKTTLYNGLTGLRRHTGNWPGKTVTVDRNEGKLTCKDCTFEIVDLPGIYSLSSRTLEEEITAEYLLNENPDIVVNIVDAQNMEKNLYLTLQLIETGIPVVIALNMNRFAAKNGIQVDAEKLQTALGVPVVKIEAVSKSGREDLLDAVIRETPTYPVHCYDEKLESCIAEFTAEGKSRWIALSALIHQKEDETEHTACTRRRLEEEYGGLTLTEIISTQKYRYIAKIMKECVSITGKNRNITDAIDKLVMNRILAVPIFLLVIFLVFQVVFAAGEPLMGLIEEFFSRLGQIAGDFLFGAPSWVTSLVVDGIIGGLGSVIVFLPNIILMFFMLAVLENSGYLARVAVIADALMKKIGLHGKSFIPMILGFGCSVPAIMASRTLENDRSKKLTMLLTPFMSCSARIPVYVLFITAFFEAYRGVILFAIYLLGIAVALAAGLILRKTVFKGEESDFIIEMPSYHVPRLRDVFFAMWDNAKEFLSRAGVIIFPAVLFVWLLATLPFGVEYASSDSVLGIVGGCISPVFAPLGFGFAEASVSIIMGLLAKEVVVGTMGTLFSCGEEGLVSVLPTVFTPLSALSFMVFVLLYIPCLAALFTMKKESHSWSFTIFAALMYLVIAWIISFIIYQGGSLLGF
ncbi:MAG TPA: ferrous iron transport protein B [Methanocorpusculum sp.]|nr:ferrous iron transport protein B [Methanocorpusculum sp.]